MTFAMQGESTLQSWSFRARAGSFTNRQTLVFLPSEEKGWSSGIMSGLGEGLVGTCARVNDTKMASSSSFRRSLALEASSRLVLVYFFSAAMAF